MAGDERRSAGVIENSTAVKHAQGRGEGKHPGVQAETVEEGHGVEHAGRNEADEEPHSPLRDREPEGAPDQGQDHAFRHELGQETRGGRTHRTSHGDLTLPTLGPHQEQAHDVDARNHEQQSRSPEEDQEGGPDVADDHVGEGRDGRALPAIRIGILGLESGRHGFEVGLRGLDGLAVLEPAHAVEPVAAAPQVAVARGVSGGPELARLRRREMELARQDPDDEGGIPVQDDRLSHDVRVASVPRLPRPVAEQDRARSREQVFARLEIPAEDGRDSKRPKEPVAHARAPDGPSPGVGAEAEPVLVVDLERVEGRVHLLPVEVVGIGEVALRKESDRLEDSHEPRRVAIRERLQERRVHESEEGDAGAGAERDREDGGGGEARVLAQLADRVAAVLKEMLDGREGASLAPSFLRGLDPAQLQEGVATCHFRGHARADVVVHVHRQVALELGRELAVAPVVGKEAGQTPEPGAYALHARSSEGPRKRARISVAFSQSRVSRSSCFRPARVSL